MLRLFWKQERECIFEFLTILTSHGEYMGRFWFSFDIFSRVEVTWNCWSPLVRLLVSVVLQKPLHHGSSGMQPFLEVGLGGFLAFHWATLALSARIAAHSSLSHPSTQDSYCIPFTSLTVTRWVSSARAGVEASRIMQDRSGTKLHSRAKTYHLCLPSTEMRQQCLCAVTTLLISLQHVCCVCTYFWGRTRTLLTSSCFLSQTEKMLTVLVKRGMWLGWRWKQRRKIMECQEYRHMGRSV